MKNKVVLLFQCESLHTCQSLAPLVETKTKKKKLLRLSLASLSPHHYSQQQRSPFRSFIARQKLSNALKSLKSKKRLQELTNRASERASECYSPHRIYNSLLRMRAIHELKMKTILILFVFILSACPRKPFQSKLSELSLRQRIGSKVSGTHLNLRQLYFYLVLVFTFVFKLFNKLHTILRIIVVFH